MTEIGLRVPGTNAAPGIPLVSSARNAEFTALYMATFHDVTGYCSALLKDDALGADVAQEAFIRLFGRWRRVANPRGFVFLVATNLVRDEWRRQGRQRALLENLKPLAPRPGEVRDRSSLDDIVSRLPRALRDVVVLHIVADLPVADVARITGVPVGTVKRRLHDARARLRLDWME